MTFDQAQWFGDNIRKLYEDLGYSIIEVPTETPNKRAEFIQNAIQQLINKTVSGEERYGK